jgi:hypothetical protein
MSADSQILTSFLVSLGFKLDEAGAKKFRTGLDDTTKGALTLGAAVMGVGIAIEKFVEQMSEGLGKLYYMSERTGATVAGLKSTAAGFEAVGLSADKANEAIESVGDMLRKPWLKAQLVGWGINVNQKTENVVNDINHKLATMWNEKGVARQQAENFAKKWENLGARDLATLVKDLPAADAMQEKVKALQKEGGVDYDDNAKKAAEFNRQMTLIGKEFDTIGNQIYAKLIPGLLSLSQMFATYLEKLITTDVFGGFNSAMNEGFEIGGGEDSTSAPAPAGATGSRGTSAPAPAGATGSRGTSAPAPSGATGSWGTPDTPTAPASSVANVPSASTRKTPPFAWNGQMQRGDGYAKGSLGASGQSDILSQELSDERQHLQQPGLSPVDIERINSNISSLLREFTMAHLTPPAASQSATSNDGSKNGGKSFVNQPTYNINVTGQDAQNAATSIKNVVRRTNDEATRNGLGVLS